MNTNSSSKLEALEKVFIKIKDIENSYKMLVEKMAQVQLEAMDAGMDSLVDNVEGPFSDASNNVKKIGDIRSSIETELNRIRNELE
jgi:hypothetical protein